MYALLYALREILNTLNRNARSVIAPTPENSIGYLTDGHIERIVAAYRNFADQRGLARVASLEEIHAKDGNLSIPLYVAPAPTIEQERASHQAGQAGGLDVALANWLENSRRVRVVLNDLLTGTSEPEKKA